MKMLIITAIFCASSLFGADQANKDSMIQEMSSVIAARTHLRDSVEISEIPVRRKTPPNALSKPPSKDFLKIDDIEAAVSARELLLSHITCGDVASLQQFLSSRKDLSIDLSHLQTARYYQQNAWKGARKNIVSQLYALANIGACTTILILDNQLFNALGNLTSTITSTLPSHNTRAMNIQANPTSILPPINVPLSTVPDILNIPTATPDLNIPGALPPVGVQPLPTVPDVLNIPALTPTLASLPATLSSITPSLAPQIAAASGILAGVSYFTYASKSLYGNVTNYFKYKSIARSLEQYEKNNLSSSKDKVE